ncbi:hypothetical protein SAY87_008058 [Trapa incisa]|uniref:Uncharacterized protein n=1 Tax=Trapa incisa TaxID=236973 RepID=A0AAN7KLL4_9MYRT|nr:hypothetical protein SAY87_008058 [Trapa incisa]
MREEQTHAKAPNMQKRQNSAIDKWGFRDWELTFREELAREDAEKPGRQGPAHDLRLQRQDTQ